MHQTAVPPGQEAETVLRGQEGGLRQWNPDSRVQSRWGAPSPLMLSWVVQNLRNCNSGPCTALKP